MSSSVPASPGLHGAGSQPCSTCGDAGTGLGAAAGALLEGMGARGGAADRLKFLNVRPYPFMPSFFLFISAVIQPAFRHQAIP